jgi:hypothetical protein
LPDGESTWRSASLVVVFPAEPVTAMILRFGPRPRRYAEPAQDPVEHLVETTIIGTVSRPSAGSLAFRDDEHRSAPAAAAAVA